MIFTTPTRQMILGLAAMSLRQMCEALLDNDDDKFEESAANFDSLIASA